MKTLKFMVELDLEIDENKEIKEDDVLALAAGIDDAVRFCEHEIIPIPLFYDVKLKLIRVTPIIENAIISKRR